MSDWFLPESERPWTAGNLVVPRVHGATYFARLVELIGATGSGDWVHFTDWRGDPDEQLVDAPDSAVARVLADLARQDVHVRGLVWRSHPDEANFSEQENLHLVETVNEAGGEVLLDERVKHAGSHHQKLFVIRATGVLTTTWPSSAGSTCATVDATTTTIAGPPGHRALR